MKKHKFFWICLSLNIFLYSYIAYQFPSVIECFNQPSIAEIVEEVNNNDVILNAKKIVSDNIKKPSKVKTKEQLISEKKLSSEEIIANDINIALKKFNRKWSNKNKKILKDTLYVGSKHYGINHRTVLSLISIESTFKIRAFNKNRNGTKDYGLCQINSINWKGLSKVSKKILDKNKIRYGKGKYNITLNVMNCYGHLNGSKYVLKKKKRYSHKKMIQSYNVGVAGSLSKSKKYSRIRKRYYSKYLIAKNEI